MDSSRVEFVEISYFDVGSDETSDVDSESLKDSILRVRELPRKLDINLRIQYEFKY
jgi:hypothetical protein